MHEVLAQKVAEKKAAAEAAAAELATYLKVQAAMTQKLSGQIWHPYGGAGPGTGSHLWRRD